jgi:hypothetical protein
MAPTPTDTSTRAVLFAAVFFTLLVIVTDYSDAALLMLSAAAGIIIWAIREGYSKRKKLTTASKKGIDLPQCGTPATTQCKPKSVQPSPQKQKPSQFKPDALQESKVPVFAPSFQTQGFASQVNELLAQITPTPESERIAQQLALRAKASIQEVFPEVDVVGFADGDVLRGTPFGVAVPDMGIVARASSQSLLQNLQSRLSKGGRIVAGNDPRKLHKAAIRVCTEQLVSTGGFKFRRSAFRGDEPKVTLMAPPSLGIASKGIPVDFSVNSLTPLCNAVLLAECGRINPCAKGLILLVRRWAKDRGICHAAKGHLAPYAWTLLAVYFMQVGVPDGPVLPALKGFKGPAGFGVQSQGGNSGSPEETKQRLVGELFRQFIRFYAKEINWNNEAVSVRTGKRSPAAIGLMLHIVVHEDKSTEVGPNIEDPFDPARNLGFSVTPLGMQRFREELSRASALMEGSELSLSVLLEPWAPPGPPGPPARPSSNDDGTDGES